MSTDTSSPQHSQVPADDEDSQLNYVIRYAMYAVFAIESAGPDDRSHEVAEVEQFLAGLEGAGVVLRGLYDVSGMRAEADLMLWWHADDVETLQGAYNAFRRTAFGSRLKPVWSNVGLHRPAEFNRAHVPAFLAGEPARRYLCVYPFVRSYDWYVLPEEERRTMLRDHGLAARDYADVRANTISSFALGDYEWLLAFEADELHRIVDLMRELRGVEARLHVREEIPFFTGPRVEAGALIERLP